MSDEIKIPLPDWFDESASIDESEWEVLKEKVAMEYDPEQEKQIHRFIGLRE